MTGGSELNQIIVKKDHEHTTNIENIDHIPVIKYKVLSDIPWLTHGFSTRIGGVSSDAFDSMNLSFTRGDIDEKVMENFKLFGGAIDIDISQMVFTDQTHTTNIKVVHKSDRGKGILFPRDYKDIDGIITNDPGVALVTFYADCVPLYFVDPVMKVIGLSHSGWRGTAAKMGMHTVNAMKEHFGCKAEDIIAAIGPSICQDCYEVSTDVALAFKRSFSETQYQQMIIEKDNEKYQLDLWKANQFVLQDSGILNNHISMPDICTCCNYKTMWSHRKVGIPRGSLAAFLMIKDMD